jgi:hypothetical protein
VWRIVAGGGSGRSFLSAFAIPDIFHGGLRRRFYHFRNLVWPDGAKTKPSSSH